MSDAPERISLELRQGMADDFWSECRDPRYAKSEPVAYVRADRLEAQEALLREALAVLAKAQGQSCEGFCEQLPQADSYTPDMGLDCATCFLRPTLAKLRAHMGEKE